MPVCSAFLKGVAERETLGPGAYDFTITNVRARSVVCTADTGASPDALCAACSLVLYQNSRPNSVHVVNLERPSVEFESSVARFPKKPSSHQRSFMARTDPTLVSALALWMWYAMPAS